MNILEVRNLKKYYKLGDNLVKAVDDVSFSVEKGEFLAIIGPSGSGKSTLLHLIGGVDRKDSGEIIVGGEDITKLSNERLAIYRRREVGIIYQFYNLIATLNVEENISISKRLDDKTVDREEMDEILRRMGLLNRRNNLPNQLSGGEMQRTSIARALINRPSLVLADEPTGNLDTKNSDEIINILREFNKNYKQTIILITHNPEIANQADRVIELVDGKIKSDVRK